MQTPRARARIPALALLAMLAGCPSAPGSGDDSEVDAGADSPIARDSARITPVSTPGSAAGKT